MREKDDIGFCFRVERGLKLVEPNENLCEVYLKKSKGALTMLSFALEKEIIDWVLETSYYARYFAIYSLFMKSGIKSEIHDCSIRALKEIFVLNGIVSEEIYENIEKSKEFRIGKFYYDKEIGKEEIIPHARGTGDFCLEVEEVVKRMSEKEIKMIRDTFLKIKGGKR